MKNIKILMGVGSIIALSLLTTSVSAAKLATAIDSNVSVSNNAEKSVETNTNTDANINADLNASTNANVNAKTETSVEQKTQERNQEQTKEQTQTETQSQVQNQDDANKEQNKERSVVSEQRRSQVANAVQEMLKVADRSGGIGEQVKIIAQDQNQNQDKLEASLAKVQDRSGFAKFFIGPNYGEINNAQKLLAQNNEQIKQLTEIKAKISNQADQQVLDQQIQTLNNANLEVNASLKASEKGFSLLGWLFKIFAK
ncbi:MAG: hypothetical protein KGI58_02555 [Patescibacteria group bacterium]|nr:hypothetical protein [Patescibacteria group bacterium]